jgi:glutaredoxin 3
LDTLAVELELCQWCSDDTFVMLLFNYRYTDVDLQKDPDGKALRAEMGERLGRTSVPAIWINGEFIGGCNDGPMGGLVTLKESGKLDTMLSAAGAI